jgi:hypothetical protein
MDPIRQHERRRQAQRRLGAQRRRAGLLRGRVVACSLIVFVFLWGVVFAQMATGNDPVLGAKSRTAAARSPRHKGGSGSEEAASEAGGTTEPEEAESEYAEPEYVEPEYAEPEYAEPEYAEPEYAEPEPAETEYVEPEPAPVETSQS